MSRLQVFLLFAFPSAAFAVGAAVHLADEATAVIPPPPERVIARDIALPHAPVERARAIAHTASLPGARAARPRLVGPGRGAVVRWVNQYAKKYGIAHHAPFLLDVIRQESGYFSNVVSPCGRYLGMCQFTPSTFEANVRAMKAQGLVPSAARFSPLDAEQSVQVMAWMWSQGFVNHWGPAARALQRMAAAPSPRPEVGEASAAPEAAAPETTVALAPAAETVDNPAVLIETSAQR